MEISRYHSISVTVITPLIPVSNFFRLQELVCTLSTTGGEVTLIGSSDDQNMSCPVHEHLVLPLFSSPYLFASEDTNEEMPSLAILQKIFAIRSPKFARIALLLRNATSLSGIDIFLKHIEATDVVVVGSNMKSYPFNFVQHILSVAQSPPLVVDFSKVEFIQSFTLQSFLHHIQYATLPRAPPLPWVQCSAENCTADTACKKCTWRQKFGNQFDEQTIRLLDTIARAASLERQGGTGEAVTCAHQPDELFQADGAKVIARMGSRAVSKAHTELHSGDEHRKSDPPRTTSPSVLCMTYSRLRRREAIRAIRNTWGSWCDGYLAFTDTTDLSISAIGIEPSNKEELQFEESYDVMWQKVQMIWIIVASSGLIDAYDYFLIGGDDLFVAVDNLREFLQSERIRNITGACS